MSAGAARAVDAVTARWAGALYGLAHKRGVLAEVVADVARLAAEIERKEVRGVLFNPRLDVGTRCGAIEPTLRGAHVLTQNFVRLAFDRGREAVLRGLAAAFHRRTLAENGEVEGLVESARPLEPADLARIEQDVGRVLGKRLILTNRLAPALVGGVRVVAESRMLDGSVQGRLDALERRLRSAQLSG